MTKNSKYYSDEDYYARVTGSKISKSGKDFEEKGWTNDSEERMFQ